MGKSESTKQQLLDAAVETVACQDCLESVSSRNIATKVGISRVAINYHFRSRQKFLKEIWSFVSDIRKGHTIKDYLDENRALLNSRDGQLQFISGMLEDFCAHFTPHTKEELWKFRVFFIMLFTQGEFRKEHVKKYFEMDMNAFAEICKTICGIEDIEMIYIWFVTFVFPLSIRYVNLAEVDAMESNMKFSPALNKRMLAFCKRFLLINLKLVKEDYMD